MSTTFFEIEEATYNRVAIVWKSQWSYNNSTNISKPFSLVSGTYPTSFILHVDPADKIAINVHTSGQGHAIVKLAVRCESNGKQYGETKRIMTFIKNWHHPSKFSDVGTLLKSLNTTLIIKCNITWFAGTSGSSDQSDHLPRSLPNVNVPLNNEKNPDFYIIIDDQRLSAHKLILAGHSLTFARMFEVPMKESEEGQVTIKDIEYSTMKIVLEIMYTGVIDHLNDIDTTLKVLQVSEEYQMASIKSVCEQHLELKIDDSNVLGFLREANKYNAAKLCYTCVEYLLARNEMILSLDELKAMATENPVIKNALWEHLFTLTRQVTVETRCQ